MDTLVANISGKAREVRRNGKTYLVAPTTLITPGVLAGSQGPLNYTEDQNRKSEGSWDGTPLVLYHPTRNGTPVSANTDESDRDEGKGLVIGEVRKDRVDPDGKLKAESWFDVERVKAADKTLHPGARVLPRLLKGIPIEVSTGLGTDSVPVKPGFDSRGRAYDREARNYRPDHLAVLPDQVGACSNHDGCGIFVNQLSDGARSIEDWTDLQDWTDLAVNWCNQHGGDTCKDGAAGGGKGSSKGDKGGSKVEKLKAKVAEAKAKLDSLKAELKKAQMDEKAAKVSVKSKVTSKSVEKAEAQAKDTATKINDLKDKFISEAKSSGGRGVSGRGKGVTQDYKEMDRQVDELIGKQSPHRVAKAMGLSQKFKNAAAARDKIYERVSGSVGAFMRAGI